MFTNWLTGSSSSSSNNSSSSNTTGSTTPAIARPSGLGVGLPGNATSLVMSSPPDVILEVGPAPSSVRFVAHSLVLGMHSGYLRSAIRLDEASTMATLAAAAAANGNSSSATGTATGELLLYLSNVTADQFAPLLTYMYTGYLDLTVDNIFAVLLATHVLHMPRALEICRSFLARAQTEGYLNGNPGQLCPTAAVPSSGAKVIRPIPSKATMPNFGFMPHMPQATPAGVAAPPQAPPAPPPPAPPAVFLNMEVAATSPRAAYNEEDNDEEEDIEVFIDSNTVTDNELDPEHEQEVEPDVDMDCNVSVVSSLAGSSAGSLNIERLDVKPTPTVAATTPALPTSIMATPSSGKLSKSKRESTHKGQGKKGRSRKGGGGGGGGGGATSTSGSGLQVAKAPVPAAQLEQLGSSGTTTTTPSSVSKFIIDVASCDGPVRFRRILNTAYGHKPEGMDTNHPAGGGLATSSASGGGSSSEQHRSQQSVSYSFHQQMARAISSQQRQLSHQQQQQQQQQQEESENSGDAVQSVATSNSSRKHSTHGGSSAGASTSGGSSNQELYVCVYCKHTFKSQYCYQKHAKRHLNPLSLTTTTTTTTSGGEKKLLAAEPPTTLASLEADSLVTAAATATPAAATSVAGATGAALLRREVRPLDMNVQYYPCKTCGSKFPSYYFVHKHRKMCHADEIEAAASNNATSNTSNTSNASSSSSSNNSNNSSSNVSKREVPAPAPGPAPAPALMDTSGEDPQQQN
ncbi:uncharacterized protein LOC110178849 [Drosophila serrata]|uniref:uncharacterized protein LOC110178849 n=1 Tax=Drosophila serrata TaxID=7274 RepID=UPI000A1CF7D5|nr:uncharacterized protein LOC110178849 [Drosophila serrata]